MPNSSVPRKHMQASPWLAISLATIPFVLMTGLTVEARSLQRQGHLYHQWLRDNWAQQQHHHHHQQVLRNHFALHGGLLPRLQRLHAVVQQQHCNMCDELTLAPPAPDAELGGLTHVDDSDSSLELEFETAAADMKELTLEVDTARSTITVAGVREEVSPSSSPHCGCGCHAHETEALSFQKSFELQRGTYDLEAATASVSDDRRLCVSIPKLPNRGQTDASSTRSISIALPAEERESLPGKEQTGAVVATAEDEEVIDLDAEEDTALAKVMPERAEATPEQPPTPPEPSSGVNDDVSDAAKLKNILLELAKQDELSDSTFVKLLLGSLQQRENVG